MLALTISSAAGTGAGRPTDPEKLLVGYWSCVRNCPDEDIAFLIEEGQHRYRSWVHMHPSIIDGEWTLKGSDLTVTRSGDAWYEWRIVKVTNTRLVLREKGARTAKDDAVMKRVHMGATR